jgi:DNA invertase Pin-like site-specific DNA recombinase
MRAAIYARVSTPRQARDRNTDQQVARLERYAESGKVGPQREDVSTSTRATAARA